MDSSVVSQKINDLLPRIRERRQEIEDARRMPKDLVADLAATGIFKFAMPAALGGDEASATDLLQAIETISAADGSTGWCAMIGAGGALFAGKMTDVGVKEVFADPALPTAGAVPPTQGTAARVDGGYQVNGKWRFASGITHVDWVMAGCVVLYDGAPKMTPMGIPDVRWVWVPISEVEIHDTWYVNGLRGTGSNDFSITDVFVPEDRTLHLFDPTGQRPEPIVRFPDVAGFATQVAAVGLGIARGALDELVELAGGKLPTMSMSSLASKAATQIEVAQLDAQLRSARSFVYDIVDEIWDVLVAGQEFTPKQNALARLSAVEAARAAAAVAHRVSTIAGGNSMYLSSSLQRHARDADAVTHHFVVSPPVLEDVGRVLLGMDPTSPIF